MMGAILRSRGLRKFRRNRMAMAATAIIAGYLIVAVAVLCGAITREGTEERIGPRSVPGFGLNQSPEKRLESATFVIRILRRAVNRADADAALDEIRFGRRRVADLGAAEIAQSIEKADRLLDEAGAADDLNEAPELLPKLDEAERTLETVFAPLSGFDAVVQGFLMMLGTDRQGRSISARAFYAVKIAFQIGVVAALFAVIFGGLLGAAAGYFGGWVDWVVQWIYSTLSSIPSLVLLGVLIFMFTGTEYEQTLLPVYAAFCMTFWIGPCRVVRGEVLRLKELDYVQAANALGAKRGRVLLRHLIPNASHLLFVNFSLLFIGAIKSEVILTFLGLGVKNEPSWGIMISQSKPEILNDFFWQIGAATVLMFGLVLAFNIFTDALQDALDPKYIA